MICDFRFKTASPRSKSYKTKKLAHAKAQRTQRKNKKVFFAFFAPWRELLTLGYFAKRADQLRGKRRHQESRAYDLLADKKRSIWNTLGYFRHDLLREFEK